MLEDLAEVIFYYRQWVKPWLGREQVRAGLTVFDQWHLRPWLAAFWLVALVAAGTAVFATHPHHVIRGGAMPPFNPFIYTLDLLIPIGAFGLRGAFAWSGPVQWLAYALIASGWILASAVIAAITRTVRRD